MSNQNDTKLETEELATDLISAIREFEETTAKIASSHQSQEARTVVEESRTKMDDSIWSKAEEKGPIDYFNRTKESLRHVPLLDHDINNNELKPGSAALNEMDERELDDSYTKVPVQQLINTFEKQMRCIIKQKINENIQLNMDDPTNKNKISATYISKDNQCSFNGKENEVNSSEPISQMATFEPVSQQLASNRIEHQVSHSIDEQYQWSTQSECTMSQSIDEINQCANQTSTINRFKSKETQPDDHLVGGKA